MRARVQRAPYGALEVAEAQGPRFGPNPPLALDDSLGHGHDIVGMLCNTPREPRRVAASSPWSDQRGVDRCSGRSVEETVEGAIPPSCRYIPTSGSAETAGSPQFARAWGGPVYLVARRRTKTAGGGIGVPGSRGLLR